MPPTGVETEFGALCRAASQDDIAATCGLASHKTISERFGKALQRGYLAAFTAEQLVRMAAGDGATQAAVIAYWHEQNTQRADKMSDADGVRREIADDAALIAKCNAACADGKISPSEASDLVLAMRQSVDHRMQLISQLERKIREGVRHG